MKEYNIHVSEAPCVLELGFRQVIPGIHPGGLGVVNKENFLHRI